VGDGTTSSQLPVGLAHVVLGCCGAYAARKGHLEALRWARQTGCEWDAGPCMYAALCGRLDLLRWARQLWLFGNGRMGNCVIGKVP
jgi:hypothetical protein